MAKLTLIIFPVIFWSLRLYLGTIKWSEQPEPFERQRASTHGAADRHVVPVARAERSASQGLRLERAETPEMLSLSVKTKQCSNEQQLTPNGPRGIARAAPASGTGGFWQTTVWCDARKEEKRDRPPLFLSFSSSWFLSCSMSLFSLAFSTISFFSSLTLAWATAADK